MTRVDFYVLPEAEDVGPVLTACRLCEKAVEARKKVYVYAPEPRVAEDLDAALWTFKQNSFLGHERFTPESRDADLCSVLIGDAEPPPSHGDVMVNLAEQPPPFFSRFERVLEIVHGDASARARSRERFKFYRDRGYPLETHKL